MKFLCPHYKPCKVEKADNTVYICGVSGEKITKEKKNGI